MNLILLPETLAIAKLPPTAVIPTWALQGPFFSITQTADELSIVTLEEHIPLTVGANKGWRAFQVQGPIDFSAVGVLNSLTAPLAEAGISIFTISTYDTDYVLVKEEVRKQATKVLLAAGHQVRL
jgi:hypothetical protein